MSEPRKYLLIVFGPRLDPEHANIKRAVEHHSEGDYAEVFKQSAAVPGAKASGSDIPFTVAYLFCSFTHASEMGFGLLNGDRYLLVEVGSVTWAEGLSSARMWLERHP